MAVKLGFKEPKTPGYLQNTQYGIFLPFQFSPTEMSINKTPNYVQNSIPGLDFQPIIWTSGGPYTITFKVAFDHRPSAIKPGVDIFGNNNSLTVTSPSNASRSQQLAANGANLLVNSATTAIPGTTQAISAGTAIGQVANGLPSVDLNLLDTSKFQTVDGKEYNENLGVLPHIAAIQSFLRPIDTSQIVNADSYKLGNLQQNIQTIKTRNNATTNRKFLGTPDCFFHFGNRVWRTKMMSAPIVETIYNQKLVPVRIEADIVLNVIEAFSYEEYISSTITRMTLAFAVSDKGVSSQQSPGSQITF